MMFLLLHCVFKGPFFTTLDMLPPTNSGSAVEGASTRRGLRLERTTM
jgi:hypothetical protein